MNRETEIKIALVIAAARFIEQESEERYETPEQLAALSREIDEQVSPGTFRRLLRTGTAKFRYAAPSHGIDSNTLSEITNPTTNEP